MSKCKYCHLDVGLFRSYHSQCHEKFKRGLFELKELQIHLFLYKKDFYLYKNKIDSIISSSFISNSDVLECF